MAATLWYFFVLKGHEDWGGRARASIIIILFVLAPVVTATLWGQHQAKSRLAETGIALHPDLGPSVGAAVGGIASTDTWLFEFNHSADAFLDFYRAPAHRTGWELTADAGTTLILKKDRQQLLVSHDDDSVAFMLDALVTSRDPNP
jgi:hypothetical protein